MEATDFADAEGDSHECSDWEIVAAEPTERRQPAGAVVWSAPCATGPLKLHIHLGDGTFRPDEFLDLDNEDLPSPRPVHRQRRRGGPVERAALQDEPPGPPGRRSAVPWEAQRGYQVEPVASGLRLPVNIAIGPAPQGPGRRSCPSRSSTGTSNSSDVTAASRPTRRRRTSIRPGRRGGRPDRDRRRVARRGRVREHGLRAEGPATRERSITPKSCGSAAVREAGLRPGGRPCSTSRNRRARRIRSPR